MRAAAGPARSVAACGCAYRVAPFDLARHDDPLTFAVERRCREAVPMSSPREVAEHLGLVKHDAPATYQVVMDAR